MASMIPFKFQDSSNSSSDTDSDEPNPKKKPKETFEKKAKKCISVSYVTILFNINLLHFLGFKFIMLFIHSYCPRIIIPFLFQDSSNSSTDSDNESKTKKKPKKKFEKKAKKSSSVSSLTIFIIINLLNFLGFKFIMLFIRQHNSWFILS